MNNNYPFGYFWLSYLLESTPLPVSIIDIACINNDTDQYYHTDNIHDVLEYIQMHSFVPNIMDTISAFRKLHKPYQKITVHCNGIRIWQRVVKWDYLITHFDIIIT